MDANGQLDRNSDTSLRETSSADLLHALQRVREEEEHREMLRHALVDELRRRRISWPLIAETLGIPERTLRRNYGRPFFAADYLEDEHHCVAPCDFCGRGEFPS
jgi:hypothetical protein